MKKILTLLVGVLCFVAAASAQPRAFGLRIGYGAEVSYQHDLSDAFAELDLGLVGKDGFYVTGVYDFILGTNLKPRLLPKHALHTEAAAPPSFTTEAESTLPSSIRL